MPPSLAPLSLDKAARKAWLCQWLVRMELENLARAAPMLGLSRQTLGSMLSTHGRGLVGDQTLLLAMRIELDRLAAIPCRNNELARIAREHLGLQHFDGDYDTQASVSMGCVRNALERAYEAGAQDALSACSQPGQTPG